ncbi:MAG: 4-vinyl reductase [Fibromonadaceae bacterium]|jgi:predicted hydrocarbon binding protein|nr:4-vinyl reductase [Fibromonadaceae bacterium]
MKTQRKYQFDWDNTVGSNMEQARPNLGPSIRIEAYRLFQFTLRDVLEQNFGTKTTDMLFREAGGLAGKAFFDRFLKDAKDVASLTTKIQDSFNTLKMGIFRVELAAEDHSHFVFTVDEDLDCSGLPDTSDVVCVYDEGFIQGILKAFSGKDFKVREIECWCTGARTCRFEAKVC